MSEKIVEALERGAEVTVYRVFSGPGKTAGDPNVRLEFYSVEQGDCWEDGVIIGDLMEFLCDDCEDGEDCELARFGGLLDYILDGLEQDYGLQAGAWTYLHQDGSRAYADVSKAGGGGR